MNEITTRRILAIHPKWTGHIILNSSGAARHEKYGTTGSYVLNKTTLRINWDKYAPEVFVSFGDTFIHQEIVDCTADAVKLRFAKLYGQTFEVGEISVRTPIEGCEVHLRVGTSDVPTFRQVFVARDYDSPNLPDTAKTIIDIGANIGLSAVFFAAKYRDARVLAVEPDEANYQLLKRNTSVFGPRVTSERAAAWVSDGEISFATQDSKGNPLGAWGGQVSTHPCDTVVPCISIASLLRKYDIDKVDILKVDIEGAEQEIFGATDTEWLSAVDLVVIETHDRFKPGSDKAVKDALRDEFDQLRTKGENLYFKRKA